MKPLGDFAVGEYVKPIIPKFYVTGPYPYIKDCGGMFIYQLQEYRVTKKFESTPRASKAEVMIEDGYRLGFTLDWHMPVLSRYEAQPEPGQLMAVIGKLHENNQSLVREYIEALPVKFRAKSNQPKVGKSRPGERTFFLRPENLGGVENMPRQAQLCVSIFKELEGHDLGVSEADLMEAMRKNAVKFNSVQDPWRIFMVYLKEFTRVGMVDAEE